MPASAQAAVEEGRSEAGVGIAGAKLASDQSIWGAGRIRGFLTRALLSTFALLALYAIAEAEEVRAEHESAHFVGDAPTFINAGIGAFDVAQEGNTHVDNPKTAVAADVELLIGAKAYSVGPLFGITGTSKGSILGFLGFYTDVAWKRLRLMPFGAVGGYRHGDGKRLGGIFEFRLGGNVVYELGDSSRLGFTVAHVSNAFIHGRDPGAETILLTYMVPLSGLAGDSSH